MGYANEHIRHRYSKIPAYLSHRGDDSAPVKKQSSADIGCQVMVQRTSDNDVNDENYLCHTKRVVQEEEGLSGNGGKHGH